MVDSCFSFRKFGGSGNDGGISAEDFMNSLKRGAWVKNLMRLLSGSFIFIFLLAGSSFPQSNETGKYIYPAENPNIDLKTQRFLEGLPADSVVAVWVLFTDKGIKSSGEYKIALDEFTHQLTLRSIERRKMRATVPYPDFSDLPVKKEYLAELENHRVKIRNVSRWLNAASVSGNREQIKQIQELPFVRAIKKVATFTQSEPVGEDKPLKQLGKLKENQVFGYGPSYAQLAQIHVPDLHGIGYSGKGVLITILDTGYWLDHQAFSPILNSGRLIATRDFINGDSNVEDQYDTQREHGTLVWSAVGGFVNDTLVGPAYGAEFALAKTERVDVEVKTEEDNWVAAVEWADSIGADVVTSSLGYNNWYTYQDMDGKTALCTIAADKAVSKGIVVTNCAGNERGNEWHYIIAPADGFGVIAVGAVDLNGDSASFSSKGPTYDGRIKPDVDACGVSTYCASYNGGYTYSSGTSLSTPLIAGVCALILEVHPDWTPTQVREALWSTASQADHPDNSMGYGIADAVKASGLSLVVSPQTLNFSTSFGDTQSQETFLNVTNWQGGGLKWKAYSSSGWVSFLPDTGITPDLIKVWVNPIELKAGINEDSIVFTAQDTLKSHQKITVIFTLVPEAEIRTFPNPFSDSLTVIVKTADVADKVKISVFTVAGELVYTFPEESGFDFGGNENGIYERIWYGRNEKGEETGSGIYLLKIDAGGKSRIVKVAKIK
jgi:hypothetical protein